ncbi:hypothetical protein V5G24_22995 [Xanthobacter sp. VTT E-85241]|uniref:phage adaptor protein n=1 Tax=Roseixanthobacter finlandensis TaxID=3119922 RepID=UPI003728FFF8
MDLDSYAGLQNEITDWLVRPDLASKAPTFIALFEADIRPKVHALEQIAISIITTTPGTATVELPATAKGVSALAHVRPGMPKMAQQSPLTLLQSPRAGVSGVPCQFAWEGGRTVRLAPIPDGEYELRAIYRENFAPLSADVASNWVLEEFPNLYLYGALGHAKTYMQDAQIAGVNTMYAPALADFLAELSRRKLVQGSTSFHQRFL